METLEERRVMDAGWQNEFVANDVDRDGLVAPLDALLIINELNSRIISDRDGVLPPRGSFPDAPRFDVTADGFVAPLDVLRIINALNGDTTPPTISAALRNDTGRSPTDSVTRDPTFFGRAIDVDTGIQSVRFSIDGGPGRSVTIAPDGSFEIVGLVTAGSADGMRRVRFVTIDGRRNESAPYEFTFQLDTAAPPAPTIDLSRGSDSGAIGDRATAFQRVTIVGNTEASAEVRVPARDLAALASNSGSFQLPGVELATGQNSLDFVVADLAGNERTVRSEFSRQEGEFQDPVLFWNIVLLDSIKRDASLPPIASRNMAIVHNAVLDAVNAIEGTPSQFVSLTAPPSASLEAAVAAAAHRVLIYAYPAQREILDAQLASSLAAIPDGASETQGVAVGVAAGDALIALRDRDGWNDFEPHAPQVGPGKWQPTSPVFAPAQLPQWATLTPFILSSPSQFRPAGPPSLNSTAYATALSEVQSLGKSNSTARTPEQTQIARFWADNPGTYTPPGRWNQIANAVADARGNSTSENARLFAELNTTLADASIASWDAKFAHDLWRPITAIREADTDGNAATQADPEWSSLLVTPAFPEYVSGHSTYSAAAAAVLAAKFGDNTTFSTMSFGLPGVVREFTSFSAAAAEAGRSRILGGIHFEFGNQDGQTLGRQVAAEVLRSFQVRSDVIAPRVVVNQEPNAVFPAVPTLTGTVLDNLSGVAALSYRVDTGNLAPLSFTSAGLFSLNVPLPGNGSSDGAHTIEFRATDAAGNTSTFAYPFRLDTVVPDIQIVAPAAASTLAEGAMLRGTASGTGSTLVSLRYQFNSGPLMTLPVSADGTFAQPLDLGTLAVGQHALRVVAVDAAGNEHTASVSVALAAPPALRIDKIWPAEGAAELGVTIRPRIDFTRAVDPSTLVSQSLFISDSAGNRLPATIVPSSDNTFAWLFLRDAMPGGTRMTITVDGSLIRGTDGQRLDADHDGTPGGLFTSNFTTVSLTVLANTSLVGVVADPGPDLKPGTPDDLSAGPDGVLMTGDDIFKLPIAGARVYIIGLEDQAIITGDDGRFQFNAVPSGNVKLVLDGLTATNEPEGVYFPEMVVDMRIDPGAVNTVMAAMEPDPARAAAKTSLGAYLPRLETSLLQNVSAATGATIGVNPESAPHLTAEQQQYLRIEILPGRMIGTDGQSLAGGQIGISTVPPELVRDMLPPGVLEHTFDITVQAPGIANFTVPAPMTFPNVFNAAPGTQLNFLSFDHTTGRLVMEGTATVSADGLSVTTDPGSGITHPGWHGVTPPGGDNKNPPRDPRNPCRQPLVDTIFNLVSLVKDVPRLAVPLAAGLAAGTAGAALGPGGAIAGFNLGFVLVESVAGKVDVVLKGIKASVETLVRGEASGRTPAQIFSDVRGKWVDVATQGAASAINPYLGYGESWRQAIREASELGENLAKLTLCSGGGSGEGPSEGEFDNSDAALEASYRGLASHFGWDPPTPAQVAEFITTYRLNIAKGSALPPSMKLLWNAGLAAARITDLLTLAAPTAADISQLQSALNTLDSFSSSIGNYDGAVQADLNALRSQADSLTMNGSTPSEPEPTYFVYESSRGVVRGYAADGNVGAFLGSSLDVTVTLFQPRRLLVGQGNFRSAASGGTGGSPVLLRDSRAADSDGDGLPDDAEFVVGTRSDQSDTDGDGFSDFRELELGLDPTGGRGLPNGVIAGVDLLGEAREAVLISSPIDPTRTLALVATGSYGLDIVDTSQLLAPTSIGRINLPGDIGDVAYDAASKIAVLPDGNNRLHFVTLADPTNPELRGSIALPSSPVRRVEVRDGFAYATGPDRIFVVDIASEALVQTVVTPAFNIVDIAIDGNRIAILESRPRVYSFVLDDDGEPVLRDQLDIPSGGGRLFLGGGIAYVTAGEGFAGGYSTVSFADPDNITLLSGVDNNSLMGRAIAVGGSGLAVLVGDNGNQGPNADIINVTDPANTGANLTRFAIPGLPRGVAIGSGIAFVSASDRGLQVLNFAGADTAGIAPTVTLGSSAIDRDPATAGLQIQEGSSIDAEASVVDDAQIFNVQFLVDNVPVARDLSYPFTFRFAAPTLASGATSITVQARAVDIGGNSTLSAPLTFQLVPDTFPPSVTFTSPIEGAKRRNLPAITVRFDEDLDPAQLLASRITLAGQGPDLAFGTADDVQVTGFDLSGSSGRILTVAFANELAADNYRLTIDSAAIADRAGNTSAAPFVLQFTKRPAVIPIVFGQSVRETLNADEGTLTFSFQTVAGQRFMFDGFRLDRPMYDFMTLTSPSGDELENRYSTFTCSYINCQGNIGGLLHHAFETGTYRLQFGLHPFQSAQDTEVSFRLLDIADQPKIALDTAVGGMPKVVPASAFLSLTGSYFNSSLRGVNELDWRESRTVAGTRTDASIDFTTPTWGSRSTVGLTNGTDANWEFFSVQWDGQLTVTDPNTYLFLDSDDGSRLWVDRDRDGQFEAAELFAGSWNIGFPGLSGPADPLAPGNYPIRIQYEEGFGENRIALKWNPGISLNPNSATSLYRFDGQAGQTIFLDNLFQLAPGGTLTYQILAPSGVVLFNSLFLGNQGRLTLPTTGEYLVRINGEPYSSGGAASVPYFQEFRLVTPETSTTALTLGAPVTGSLTEPGEYDHYTFEASAGDSLFFDSRALPGRPRIGDGLRVEITGPGGFQQLFQEATIDSLLFQLSRNGVYNLRIYGSDDSVGDYAFTLHKLAAVPSTPLDTPIGEGLSLDTERTTRLFRFAANAGQSVFFDSTTVFVDATWRLLDLKGQQIFSSFLAYDAMPVLPYSGDYLLTLENNSSTTTAPFSFRLVTPEIVAQTLDIGQTVSATITEPGEIRRYSFNAAPGDTLYLDRGLDSVGITISDVQGTMLVNSFNQGMEQPFAIVNPGVHTVTVESSSFGGTPSFSFRLLKLPDQPAKNLGDPLSLTLDPGHQSVVYRYTLTAGQPVYFDGAGDGNCNGRATLYGPASQALNEACFGSDFAATAPVSGEYLLVFRGESNSAVTASGELRSAARAQQALPAFDTLVAGTLADAGDRTAYTFTASAGEAIQFFPLGNGANINVVIQRPQGGILWSGGANSGSNVLQITRTGTYTLELSAFASNAQYGFELSRLSTSESIAAGVAFGGTLAAGQDVQVFQWPNGQMGQKVNIVALGADSNDAIWSFYTQYGVGLAAEALQHSAQGIVLPSDGPYWFIARTSGNTASPIAFQFRIDDVTDVGGSMTGWDTVIQGTIGSGGTVDIPLNGMAGRPVFFDSLDPDFDSATVTLLDRDGTPVALFNHSASNNNGPFTLQKTGDYTLRVQGTIGHDYRFQLLDLGAAPMVSAGGSLPGGQLAKDASRVFRFAFEPGERYFLDSRAESALEVTQFESTLTLLNSNFAYVDQQFVLTPSNGAVNYVFVRNVYNSPIEVNAVLLKLSDQPTLPFDSAINASIDPPRQADLYRFTADANETVYIAGSGSYNCGIRLMIVHADQVSTSSGVCVHGDIEFKVPVSAEYYLYVDGAEAASQNYSFTAYRATTTVTHLADRESPVSGALSKPGDIKEYTFAAAAGEELYLDVLAGSAANLSYNLTLPDGTVWYVGAGASETGQAWQLPQSGIYRLAVDGSGRSIGNFNFRLVDLADSPVLPLNSLRLDTLPAVGEAKFMRFQAEAGQRLYFDAYDASQSNDACAGDWTVYSMSSPQSNNYVSNGLCGDSEFTAPATAAYLLRFTTDFSNAGGPFHFRLTTSETIVTPLEIGAAYGASFAWSPPNPLVQQYGQLAFATSGRLFGVFGEGPSILEFNPTTGAVIGAPINLGTAGIDYYSRVLAINSDGDLFVAGPNQNFVSRFSSASGEYLGKFVASQAGGLTSVRAMAFGPDGNLYVATGNNYQTILRFGPDGGFLNTFVDGASINLNQITSLAFAPDGTLFVSSIQTGLIYRFAAGTGAYLGTVGTLAQHGSAGIQRVFVLGNGDLLLANHAGVSPRLVRLERDSWRYLGDVALPASFYWEGTLANAALDSSERLIFPEIEYGGGVGLRIQRFGTTPLAGCLEDSVLCAPGTVREYRFQGQAGQRLFFDSLRSAGESYGPYERVVFAELHSPTGQIVSAFTMGGSFYGQDFEPLFVLPHSGEYRLRILNNGDRLADFRFRLLDATASPVLAADSPAAVSLSGFENQLFRIEAIKGQRFYIHDPDDSSDTCGIVARVLNSAAQMIASGCLSVGFDWSVVETDTYFVSLLRQNIFNNTPARIELGSRPPLVRPLPPLGNVVADSIDRPGDRHEYTFQGVYGQRLLASVNKPRNLDTVGFGVYSPSGLLLAGYLGSGGGGEAMFDFGYGSQSFESAYFLAESGEYRIVIDPPSDRTWEYAFQIADVSTLPELPLGTAWTGSVTASERDDSFQFTAVAGQEFDFDSLDESDRNGYLRIIGPGNQTVLGRGLFDDFQFTAPGPGTYIVSIISFEAAESVAYDFRVTTSALRTSVGAIDSLADSAGIALPATATLSPATLASTVLSAFDAWSAAGLGDRDWFARRFASVSFELVDLPIGYLGLTIGDRVLIDIDGSGRGWRLPSEPVVGVAAPNDKRFDLLTVVAHEIGHVLGLDHAADSAAAALMADQLAPGDARRPATADVDALFDAWGKNAD